MFGIKFRMVGANSIKELKYHSTKRTCNSLVNSQVLSPQAEPITWGKPAGCSNSPWALAYATDCSFKEFFLILGIKMYASNCAGCYLQGTEYISVSKAQS